MELYPLALTARDGAVSKPWNGQMSIQTGLSARFRPLGPESACNQRRIQAGNSTMASPVATFSPAWFCTSTSITTQRDFAVACFDLMMPIGLMVSPGRTGLTHLV